MSNQSYSPDDPRGQSYQQPPNQPPVEEQGYAPVHGAVRSSNVGGAYERSQSESYVDPAGNQIEQHEQVFEDKNQSRANTRYWIATVTYFILGVLEIILLLRLFFRLLAANQYNSFILFLYNLSHAFVGPFNGIFNDQALGKGGVFEISTVIAMIVYALIAWGIVSLGRVVFAPNQTGRQTITTSRRDRY